MAQIKVSSAKLTEGAGKIDQIVSRLETELQGLRSDATRLTGMWEGDAKQAFVTSVNQNANLVSTFINNLKKFSDALKQDAADYESGENKAKEIASTRRG